MTLLKICILCCKVESASVVVINIGVQIALDTECSN